MFVLSERNRYLTVSSPDVEDGSAVAIEELEKRLLLNPQHPLTNGVAETLKTVW
jgi:hypothetical protein